MQKVQPVGRASIERFPHVFHSLALGVDEGIGGFQFAERIAITGQSRVHFPDDARLQSHKRGGGLAAMRLSFSNRPFIVVQDRQREGKAE